MPRYSGSIPHSDPGLDHARELVARILDFLISDNARLTRFLQLTGFPLEALRATARSPSFMLSVFGAIAEDEQLLRALSEHEQITPEIIEMTRAALAFQVSLETIRQGQENREAASIGERVKR